jgi:hypothetical protein
LQYQRRVGIDLDVLVGHAPEIVTPARPRSCPSARTVGHGHILVLRSVIEVTGEPARM